MQQRKLIIHVTEELGGVLAEDSLSVRWELFPYDFEAVERSLDVVLMPAKKIDGHAHLTFEERQNHTVHGSPLGEDQ